MTPDNPRYGALMTQLRRALVDRRQAVEIGDFIFRFQRRGEEFDSPDGEHTLKALQTGIYRLCPVFRGGERQIGKWIYAGYSDDLEDILKQDLAPLSEEQVEALSISITANDVLNEMNQERQAARARRAAHP